MKRPAAAWQRLLPKEHGATVELAFALVSGLVLGHGPVAAILLAGSAVLLFCSHEPLAVLAGQRGRRLRAELGGQARAAALFTLVGGLGLGAAGLGTAPPAAFLALALPAGLALLLLLALGAGVRERSLPVELVVSTLLASLAPALALVGDAPSDDAVVLGAVWAVSFGLGTLAARGALHRRKDGGRGLRLALAAGASVSALGGAALLHGASPELALAPAPWALVAIGVALFPPPPDRMARLGLGLVGASALTLGAVLVAL